MILEVRPSRFVLFPRLAFAADLFSSMPIFPPGSRRPANFPTHQPRPSQPPLPTNVRYPQIRLLVSQGSTCGEFGWEEGRLEGYGESRAVQAREGLEGRRLGCWEWEGVEELGSSGEFAFPFESRRVRWLSKLTSLRSSFLQGSSLGNYSTKWMNDMFRNASGNDPRTWLGRISKQQDASYPPIKILFRE